MVAIALVRSLSGDITVDDLPESLASGGRGQRLTRLEWHERQALLTALRDAAGDREAAARKLGHSRDDLPEAEAPEGPAARRPAASAREEEMRSSPPNSRGRAPR